jgi:hypothetical protein
LVGSDRFSIHGLETGGKKTGHLQVRYHSGTAHLQLGFPVHALPGLHSRNQALHHDEGRLVPLALGSFAQMVRRHPHVVARSIEAFHHHPRFVLLVPPAGTRSKVMTWKTGFYHIAMGANVPIVLGYLDYRRKVGGIGPIVHPTGDMEGDMRIIRDYYAGITAKYPKQALISPASAE